jgi:hypothetical protein
MNKKFGWVWLLVFAVALASAAIIRREPLWLMIFDLALAIFCAFISGVSWLSQRQRRTIEAAESSSKSEEA